MRMWMIDPKILCRKHLLGEHLECHMILGSFKKKKSIDGFIRHNLIEPLSLFSRHNDLKWEMLNRGMDHKSHLVVYPEDVSYLPNEQLHYKINVKASLSNLLLRCPECKARYEAIECQK